MRMLPPKYNKLSEEKRKTIEHNLIESCKSFLKDGDSISYSIAKAFRESILSRGLATEIIRKDPEMKLLFDERYHFNKQKRQFNFNYNT